MSFATYDSVQTNQLAVNNVATVENASINVLNAGTLTANNIAVNTLFTTTNITTPKVETTLVEAPAGSAGALLIKGTSSTGDILFETNGSVKATIQAVSGGLLRRDLIINQTPGQILTAEQSGAIVFLTSGPIFLPPAQDGLTFGFIVTTNDPTISVNALVGNTITGISVTTMGGPTYFETVVATASNPPGSAIGGSLNITASGSTYRAMTPCVFFTP